MSTHADWLSLVGLSGLVVSEPVLEERFPGGPTPVSAGDHHWFRRKLERYRVALSGSAAAAPDAAEARRRAGREWLAYLLRDLTGLTREVWWVGSEVPGDYRVRLDEFAQELVPDWAVARKGKAALLVQIVPPEQGLDRPDRTPGRWKASPTTKLDRLLRDTGCPLGLVSNGDELRLLHAPPGFGTGQITWSTRLLGEEKATLDALTTLLSRELLLAPEGEADLAGLCRLSLDRQGEVADQLGEQVRNGLERLLWAWDRADRESDGALLGKMTDDQVYEMGLVVMMRLVFLLYAEERHLLPHGQVLYDQAYGLTWLWHHLERQRREAPARLDDSFDAWDRFLATGRLVHGGSRHPDLSLIAYGGRLFDPRRFPALESAGCRVPNRVFHAVLKLLLFARQRKGAELQRVGYWALDVEQIGYVYEGLLDHRAARAGAAPMVKLRGGGEAALPLTELEAAAEKGEAELVEVVAAALGRKKAPEKERLAARLAAPVEARDVEKLAAFPTEVAARVRPFANVVQCAEVVPPGWRYLTTGTSRRASGAHYTPPSLTERVVKTTLEPLVYRCEEGKPGKYLEPRQVRSPRELLELKVCDLAMGSGAFLVQAIRYLGERLVEAWDRALLARDDDKPLALPYAEPAGEPETDHVLDPEDRDAMTLHARRHVAERCIYGVDINPLAVEMAKLSLWLTTLAKNRPFTFLDHALKSGDSLVGVSEEQLKTWTPDGEGQLHTNAVAAQEALAAARCLRSEIQALPVVDAADVERKTERLTAADAAVLELRVMGDKLVAEQLPGYARSFHWFLEFPEVFERTGFDAFVGNPPFMGGQKITGQLGQDYRKRLVATLGRGKRGSADLVSYFLLAAMVRLRAGGTLGLVTTNTIAQGDTRENGIDQAPALGVALYDALRSMPWPGQASLEVSLLHAFRGTWAGPRRLDGVPIDAIPTTLQAGVVGTPRRLAFNAGVAYLGANILGTGFFLTDAEANQLLETTPSAAEIVRPFLNGQELNDDPLQRSVRQIIDFGERTLEEANSWPELVDIVRHRVKPNRDRDKRSSYRKYWWRFAETRPSLKQAIAKLDRVLVVCQTSKHHGFVFAPTSTVFSTKVVVFATDEWKWFANLQNSIHGLWSHRWGGRHVTRPVYTPSDCFDTFPFPTSVAGLEEIGERYHEHRRQLMVARQLGLTKTYNLFHNPKCKDADIVQLRALHVEMDHAVRDAYGWSDLDLGHDWQKTVTTREKKDRKTGIPVTVEKVSWRYTISDAAREELLRRLLALNHERYAEEVRQGLHDKKKPKNQKKAANKPEQEDPKGKSFQPTLL